MSRTLSMKMRPGIVTIFAIFDLLQMLKKRLLLLVFVCLPTLLLGQIVYEPVTGNPVYELLDELASLKVITINSLVKPYSRVYIANKLKQALENGQKLNKRQLEEVKFYLKDYSFENGLENNLINGLVTPPRTKKSDTSRFHDAGSGMQVGEIKGKGDRLRDSTYCILHPASFRLNPVSFRLNTAPFKLTISPTLGARFQAYPPYQPHLSL